MRFLSALFLIILIAALGYLTYENNRDTAVNAWKWSWDVPLPLVVIVSYALGMLTGWWLLSLVRRSWQRVT